MLLANLAGCTCPDLGQCEPSPVGIGIAAVSVVTPLLVLPSAVPARELGSATVVADSLQTLLCTWLSVLLLVGLMLNPTLDWSWAAPVAALVIAAVAVREGIQAWRREQCPDCAIPTRQDHAGSCDCVPGCTDTCCTLEAVGNSDQLHNTRAVYDLAEVGGIPAALKVKSDYDVI